MMFKENAKTYHRSKHTKGSVEHSIALRRILVGGKNRLESVKYSGNTTVLVHDIRFRSCENRKLSHCLSYFLSRFLVSLLRHRSRVLLQSIDCIQHRVLVKDILEKLSTDLLNLLVISVCVPVF